MQIDNLKIEEFRQLPNTEGKQKLADYAMSEFNVKLSKQRSFDNMLLDLEEAIKQKEEPVVTADTIDTDTATPETYSGITPLDEPLESSDIKVPFQISSFTIEDKTYGFYSLIFPAYDELVNLYKNYKEDWSTHIDEVSEDYKELIEALVTQLADVENIQIQDTRNGYITTVTLTSMTVNSLVELE